jgi:hypothetical protein
MASKDNIKRLTIGFSENDPDYKYLIDIAKKSGLTKSKVLKDALNLFNYLNSKVTDGFELYVGKKGNDNDKRELTLIDIYFLIYTKIDPVKED